MREPCPNFWIFRNCGQRSKAIGHECPFKNDFPPVGSEKDLAYKKPPPEEWKEVKVAFNRWLKMAGNEQFRAAHRDVTQNAQTRTA